MSEQEKTKDEYIVDFIKAFKAVEDEMEPYKEHRRDLKKNYVDNGWLDKDEIKMAMKAYKMIKDDIDLDQLMDFYETVGRSV